jgi:hypothetical protein
MHLDDVQLPYYKLNRFIRRWTYVDAEEGCRPVHGIQLSADRPPPGTLTQETASSPPTPLVKRDKFDVMIDDIERMVDAYRRFKVWLATPEPPPPPPSPSSPPKDSTAPPFDIQEIPGAMRKQLMPVSAQLMERWFAGELNYSRTDADEKAETNQNGQPYPPSMYDMTTVRLQWVLEFRRAQEQYDTLIKSLIRTPRAQSVLRSLLLPHGRPDTTLDAWTTVGANLPSLHRQFEFQYASVGSTLAQKIGELMRATFRNYGAPDDLTGALGSFNIYAAVAYAHFNEDASKAAVTGIYVYVKDNYTFTDTPGAGHSTWDTGIRTA